MSDSESRDFLPSPKQELRLFLILTVVLAPVLSVAIVGGYGFAVWIGQMLSAA